MFAVALEKPPSAIELLAQILGSTPYDTRMKIATGMPAVIALTNDRARAVEVLGAARAQGMAAFACDTSAVVDLSAMIAMRDFRFDPQGIIVQDTAGRDAEALAWDDVLCLLRAVERGGERTTKTEKETSFSAGRVLLTGGAVMTKTTSRQVEVNTETRENVLLLFRKSAQTPFILRESAAHYTALGAARASTTMANFNTCVKTIRERAPHAPFDERLVQRKLREDEGGLALLAHLTAMSFARA